MTIEYMLHIIFPVLTGIISFFIVYKVMPVIINVSHRKLLFDDPSEARKLHANPIPNLGGIAIFCGVTIAFLLSSYSTAGWVPYLMAGLIVLFFSGIKDDIVMISPNKKLALQILAISAPIVGADLVITDIGGVFGLSSIPYWAGLLLTFFTMVVVVNAYNLIDGIDGLAGGIGIIASLFFAGWFLSAGLFPEAMLATALAGALAGFLWYNFEPASIFMGDTGSQVVGYILAFLAARFVEFGITTEMSIPFKNEVPVLILAVLIVPLYDTLRVFLIRTLNGRSPFSADRLHVHHQLLDAGFSHKTACFIIYSLNISIIGLTLAMANLNVNVMFAAILGLSIVLFPTMGIKRWMFAQIGIRMPSARHINILERKYGFTEKTIGKNLEVVNTDIKNNGDDYDGVLDEHDTEEAVKV